MKIYPQNAYTDSPIIITVEPGDHTRYHLLVSRTWGGDRPGVYIQDANYGRKCCYLNPRNFVQINRSNDVNNYEAEILPWLVHKVLSIICKGTNEDFNPAMPRPLQRHLDFTRYLYVTDVHGTPIIDNRESK